MTERLHFHSSLSCIGEGNGNPLQSSCLESPRDGGAWRAAVSGVAQSRTRLIDLAAAPAAVGKNLPANAGDMGLIPGQGTKILQAAQCGVGRGKPLTLEMVSSNCVALGNYLISLVISPQL